MAEAGSLAALGREDRSESSKNARRAALDGVRAIAALGVVLYHCLGVFKSHQRPDGIGLIIDNLGNFGVAVFFLLSGYLLFREFVRWILFGDKRVPLPHYFERRFLRIYPAYWLAIIGYVLVVGPQMVKGDVVGIFTLFGRSFDHSNVGIGLGVAWTLMIEVLFYIALPIIAFALHLVARFSVDPRKRLAVVLTGLGVMTVSAHLWMAVVIPMNPRDPAYSSSLFPYLGWFALGMLLATATAWVDSGRQLPSWIRGLAERTGACWLIFAVAYFAVAVEFAAFSQLAGQAGETLAWMQFRIAFQGIAAFFFILPIVLGGDRTAASRLLALRPLPWIGLVSYGVYLWHLIVIRWVLLHMRPSATWSGFMVMVAIVVPTSILIGWLSHRFVETRFMRLAR